MAKGQVRGNRETRKPKKDKSVAKSSAPEGALVKSAGSATPFGKKK
jgi:hypothetical protein